MSLTGLFKAECRFAQMSVGFMEPEKAQNLVGPYGAQPLQIPFTNSVLFTASFFDYSNTPAGLYQEVAIMIPANEPVEPSTGLLGTGLFADTMTWIKEKRNNALSLVKMIPLFFPDKPSDDAPDLLFHSIPPEDPFFVAVYLMLNAQDPIDFGREKMGFNKDEDIATISIKTRKRISEVVAMILGDQPEDDRIITATSDGGILLGLLSSMLPLPMSGMYFKVHSGISDGAGGVDNPKKVDVVLQADISVDLNPFDNTLFFVDGELHEQFGDVIPITTVNFGNMAAQFYFPTGSEG